jgi:16S rRNA (adenine1518-N6/adenine1519-N6)-dimethyltransferase
MANDFEKYGVRPSKKLGQNFLIDKNISSKIARQLSRPEGKIVMEIGCGLGGLTEHLLELPIQKLIAVEYDRACIKYLHDLQENNSKIQIVAEDALRIDENALVEGNRFSIVSNLPYNISVVLLIKWLDKLSSIDEMVLMFQKEVAERIAAKPGSKVYGIVSVLAQYMCNIEYCFDVPPTVFYPPPKVMSGIVRVVPKKMDEERIITYQKIKMLCNKVFNQRRKMLRNTLKDIFEDPEKELQSIGLNGQMRPEELSVEDFERLVKRGL